MSASDNPSAPMHPVSLGENPLRNIHAVPCWRLPSYSAAQNIDGTSTPELVRPSISNEGPFTTKRGPFFSAYAAFNCSRAFHWPPSKGCLAGAVFTYVFVADA